MILPWSLSVFSGPGVNDVSERLTTFAKRFASRIRRTVSDWKYVGMAAATLRSSSSLITSGETGSLSTASTV